MYPSRQDGFDCVAGALAAAIRLVDEQMGAGKLAVLLCHSMHDVWPAGCRTLPWLPPSEFHAICAAADLVVAAGSLSLTTVQSLRSAVPVVIWSLPGIDDGNPWGWGQREAHAAWNAGLVQRLAGCPPASAIASALHSGLTDAVLRREQLRAASDDVDGAAAVVARLEDLVGRRRAATTHHALERGLLSAAVAARQDGRLGEASALLREYLAANPNDAGGHRELGEAAFASGDWAVAAHALATALELSGVGVTAALDLAGMRLRLAHSLWRWGRCLRDQARWEESWGALHAAVTHARHLVEQFGPNAPALSALKNDTELEVRREVLARSVHELADALASEGGAARIPELLRAVPQSLSDHPRVLAIATAERQRTDSTRRVT
jgi:tetratricopeptide (TPR) repeat protein